MSVTTVCNRCSLGQFSFSAAILNLENANVYQLPSIDRTNHRITLFHRIILGEECQEEYMLMNS